MSEIQREALKGSKRFIEYFRPQNHIKQSPKKFQKQDKRDLLSEAACHIVMIYCPLPSDLYNLCQQQGKQMAFEGLELRVWEMRQQW